MTDANAIPKNLCRLRFMTANGSEALRDFDPSVSIGQVKQQIYGNWPAGFERADSTQSLRIIYQGKIVDDAVTLTGLKVAPGVLTTVHLHIRPSEHVEAPKQTATVKSKQCCTLL